MNVEELINYLEKCDKRAEVLVQTGTDEAKSIRTVTLHFSPQTIGGDYCDNDFVDHINELGKKGELLEPSQKVILESRWGLYGRYNFEETMKLLDKIKLELDTVKVLKNISKRDLTESEELFLKTIISELELTDVINEKR